MVRYRVLRSLDVWWISGSDLSLDVCGHGSVHILPMHLLHLVHRECAYMHITVLEDVRSALVVHALPLGEVVWVRTHVPPDTPGV